jgi:hypothetical protein
MQATAVGSAVLSGSAESMPAPHCAEDSAHYSIRAYSVAPIISALAWAAPAVHLSVDPVAEQNLAERASEEV